MPPSRPRSSTTDSTRSPRPRRSSRALASRSDRRSPDRQRFGRSARLVRRGIVNVSSVALEDVHGAAARRSASLVPETSGYLALAVGGATARLPFRVEDRSITLTTEGSVVVARGDQVISPSESARLLRDVLARLLSCSAGTMPGL